MTVCTFFLQKKIRFLFEIKKNKVNHVSQKKSRSTSPNIFTAIISLSYVISDTIKLLLWKRVRAMEIITVRKSINIYWHARTHMYTMLQLPNGGILYVTTYSVELSTAVSEFVRKVHNNSNSLVPLNNNNATPFNMLYNCYQKSFYFIFLDIVVLKVHLSQIYFLSKKKKLFVSMSWFIVKLLYTRNHFTSL